MKREPSRCAEVADEALVDLDLVEREAAQIAERRIAGAEIVHRDAHAKAAQLHAASAIVSALLSEQHRFGDLQLEPLRRQAGRAQAR